MPIVRIDYKHEIKQTLPHHWRPATEENPHPPSRLHFVRQFSGNY
ncbi:hypothetical protein HanHA89_Chr05g0205051 [Helianthus annuus]|nr:hypothetical protein HanHA89_Chr05g0205051 [Helianthus annuus]